MSCFEREEPALLNNITQSIASRPYLVEGGGLGSAREGGGGVGEQGALADLGSL